MLPGQAADLTHALRGGGLCGGTRRLQVGFGVSGDGQQADELRSACPATRSDSRRATSAASARWASSSMRPVRARVAASAACSTRARRISRIARPVGTGVTVNDRVRRAAPPGGLAAGTRGRPRTEATPRPSTRRGPRNRYAHAPTAHQGPPPPPVTRSGPPHEPRGWPGRTRPVQRGAPRLGPAIRGGQPGGGDRSAIPSRTCWAAPTPRRWGPAPALGADRDRDESLGTYRGHSVLRDQILDHPCCPARPGRHRGPPRLQRPDPTGHRAHHHLYAHHRRLMGQPGQQLTPPGHRSHRENQSRPAGTRPGLPATPPSESLSRVMDQGPMEVPHVHRDNPVGPPGISRACGSDRAPPNQWSGQRVAGPPHAHADPGSRPRSAATAQRGDPSPGPEPPPG